MPARRLDSRIVLQVIEYDLGKHVRNAEIRQRGVVRRSGHARVRHGPGDFDQESLDESDVLRGDLNDVVRRAGCRDGLRINDLHPVERPRQDGGAGLGVDLRKRRLGGCGCHRSFVPFLV